MNYNNIYSILFATLLVFASCRNSHIDMATVINEDGSCHSEIAFEADSASMNTTDSVYYNICGVLNNDAWEKSWIINDTTNNTNGQKNGSLMCYASRDFLSTEDMAKHYPVVLDGKPMLKQNHFEKKFSWFYTEYTYSEVFVDNSHHFPVPLTKYMNEEKASYMLTGQPNIYAGMTGMELADVMGNDPVLISKWYIANIYYFIANYFATLADSDNNAGITGKTILSRRDGLIDYAVSRQIDTSAEMLEGKRICSTFKEYYGTDWFDSQEEQLEICQIPILKDRIDIGYKLTMPGKVTDCGNGIMKDGKIEYRITDLRMLSGNYTITATSRTTNTWAYIITIALVLIAISSYFYKKH